MKEYRQKFFKGERALFAVDGVKIYDSIFDEGESPLKESKNVEIYGSQFKYKYPIWYSNNVKVEGSNWLEMARSGVWYTKNISVKDALIQAPKNFRRCDGVSLENVTMTHAEETFWMCKNIKLKNVTAAGHYFAMNSENIEVDGFKLDGNYSFDSAKNVTIRNAVLLSKDAFWNTENVTVYDSYICGEYLGWNSKNLTFVNCTIESLQGMCYVNSITMKNCKLINTTLAFEYAYDLDAEITTKIDSVFNPGSGSISAPAIDTLIVEPDQVDPSKTNIVCAKISKNENVVEWRREYGEI